MNLIRRLWSRLRGHDTGHRDDTRSRLLAGQVHDVFAAEAERLAQPVTHLRYATQNRRIRPGCDPIQPCGIRFDNDADRAYETICVRHARPAGRHHRQQSDPAEPIILASVTDMPPRARVRERQP